MNREELEEMARTEREACSRRPRCIRVCTGTGCISAQSDRLAAALRERAAAGGITPDDVLEVGCMGLCACGPLVQTECSGNVYQNVRIEDADELLKAAQGEETSLQRCNTGMPFFTRQKKIVLENAGRIDPERIESYVSNQGYHALLDVLHNLRPAQVIEIITASGLRGRGGAGYPTGLKWATVAKAAGTPKYVICNGDEGDPGAFMDRSVMEDDPHRVLEGMTLGAWAVGASQGIVYVRAEYPRALKRLKTAISRAERHNLLGTNIAGSGFSFSIELRVGAGAFVCGEETALIASIQGGRGTPRPRPPYPAQAGLWNCPTLINNVETWASVPAILRSGSEWYASMGVGKSRGTKVFCLTGAVCNTGLIEVEIGKTLREIVFDIGGGIRGSGTFKAVQTGGPSGGCIPEELLDTPVDYESLRSLGSIMGSGGMIVMDQHSCMVDVARYFMEFCKSESCGKCIPCRAGTAEMALLLRKIAEGLADAADVQRLERLCEMVQETSLCGLGQSAPNPVRSTLRYFRDEVMAHVLEKRCPAGVCPITRQKGEPTHA